MVRITLAGQTVSLKAQAVYQRADGAITRKFFKELGRENFSGKLAIQLFKVQSALRSEQSYESILPQVNGSPHIGEVRARNAKDARLDELCDLLESEESNLEWGCSPTDDGFLISVRTPSGWISFHSTTVCRGPDVSSPKITTCPKKNRQRLFNFCNDVISRGERVFDGYVFNREADFIRDSIEAAKMLGRMRRPKRKKKKRPRNIPGFEASNSPLALYEKVSQSKKSEEEQS